MCEMRIVFAIYIYIYIFEHILTGIRIEKQKIVRRFTQEIKFGQGFQNTKWPAVLYIFQAVSSMQTSCWWRSSGSSRSGRRKSWWKCGERILDSGQCCILDVWRVRSGLYDQRYLRKQGIWSCKIFEGEGKRAWGHDETVTVNKQEKMYN